MKYKRGDTMHVVVVTEKDGKIELTKEELQQMLDEAYAQGRTDGTYVSVTSSQWDTDPNKWIVNRTYLSDYAPCTELRSGR